MDKWYAIAIIAFVMAMFGGGAYSDYQKSQCKQALALQNYSAEDIARAC